MSKAVELLMLIAMLGALPSCGWIQGLRKEIDDEEHTAPRGVANFDYHDPVNRFVPPPPANVADTRAAPVAGTPVDLSGFRAKQMRTTAKDFYNENLKNENSLWLEDGQTNYLFARNKLK